MIHHCILLFAMFVSNISCRDFYAGMFKDNDFLVAQDRLYKEKVPYRFMYAKYGRYFKCPITYFRVVDRLGIGRGPQVQVVRGGIRYKYIVLRLRSGYNLPISVNIYVGCENKMTKARVTSGGNRAVTRVASGGSQPVTRVTEVARVTSKSGSTTHVKPTVPFTTAELKTTIFNEANVTASDSATTSVAETTTS